MFPSVLSKVQGSDVGHHLEACFEHMYFLLILLKQAHRLDQLVQRWHIRLYCYLPRWLSG